jgi:hypothetical protein
VRLSPRVSVIHQQGTLADFEGDSGETETDVIADHDAWGVDTE